MSSSSDPELKGAFSISTWMKTKPGGTRELEPFAASPPPHEDFFYIRYPKTEALFKPKQEPEMTIMTQDPKTSAHAIREPDWSRHTKPCQDVLHGIGPAVAAANPPSLKPKPAGTDDGFKGEGAACGSSVLKVAHKMISSNRPINQRGFAVAAIEEETSQDINLGNYNLSARRGSKSLPVTPSHSPPGSPNSRRRRNANRFFTSPFEPSDATSGRSWLTAALLGYKKELRDSTSTLAEEDTLETRLQGNSSLAASVEYLGPSPSTVPMEPKPVLSQPTQEPKLAKPAQNFRPKPSELRELNFWSPTSM